MSNHVQADHAQRPAGARDVGTLQPVDHDGSAPEPSRNGVSALPKWRLRRVERHIAEHFSRRVSLAELAGVAGLSRMHFAAQFRTATGCRPREYLLQHRTEQAKTLLATTERPLAEIALAVGFSTQAHFSTVFKRVSGETPARWRVANKRASAQAEPQPRRPSRPPTWIPAPYAGSNARIGGRLPVNFSTSIVVS